MKQFIFNALTSNPHFERVFLSTSVKQSDTEKDITALITNALGVDAVHALTRGEHNSELSATYSLTSSQPLEINGMPVVQNDVYLVQVRATSMVDLIDAKEKLINKTALQQGIEIIDMLEDYDDDSKMKRLNVAISLTSLKTTLSSYPAALIIDGESSAGSYPEASARYSQVVTDEVIIITASDNWKTTRDAVFNSILGKLVDDRPIIYAQSQAIAQAGGLHIYAHTFNHSFRQRGS